MLPFGFLRVAAAVPRLRVADCSYNAECLLELFDRAGCENIDLLAFPELALTGYTCGDLFQQPILQKTALQTLLKLTQASAKVYPGLAVVGLPLVVDDQLFNCAAVVNQGNILGVVPKAFLPNYKEFYEARWFAPACRCRSQHVVIGDCEVPFGTDLLFDAGRQFEGLVVGVEICEDLWVPIPPSSYQSLAGATVLVNLSASNEVIGKAIYRRQLVVNQSGRCLAAYLYTSCGPDESTTDVVFGGHGLIAENGILLGESQRFQRQASLLVADVDLERLGNERQRTNSFGENFAQEKDRAFRRISFALPATPPLAPPLEGGERGGLSLPLRREIDAHPFVPRGVEQLRERCEDIFHTQVAGLAKRLEHLGKPPVVIGISGGLDSTLALLVACKTMDLLGVSRDHIRGFTMPGFGTTSRTRNNAQALMQHLGVTASEVDIRLLCLEEMRALGHRPFGIDLAGLTVEQFNKRLQNIPTEHHQDLVFENVQARMRTSILMNAGFVIGTGDLSELALGWCTYNGDHMNMYNPNVSIPKTLVKFLVRWAAENEFEGEGRQTLLDIVATVISPELLPVSADGGITQVTEGVVGPYELHDFFLFHFLRYGAPPRKILFLAQQARFERTYAVDEIRHWLTVFLRRFFANQFKRSCMPDGPKVGSISLSPRGDWRMPSDAQVAEWLKDLH